MKSKKSLLEQEFNRCWSEMLTKCYTCKCKDKEGFAIRMKDVHIFGKDFKEDFFKTIEENYALKAEND